MISTKPTLSPEKNTRKPQHKSTKGTKPTIPNHGHDRRHIGHRPSPLARKRRFSSHLPRAEKLAQPYVEFRRNQSLGNVLPARLPNADFPTIILIEHRNILLQ